MLVSFAQPCQGIPVRDRQSKTGNIAVSPQQNARMELPAGQLDTLETAAALLEAGAAATQPCGTGEPEDAGLFFTEGMQQMGTLNYPEHVRADMAKYPRQ